MRPYPFPYHGLPPSKIGACPVGGLSSWLVCLITSIPATVLAVSLQISKGPITNSASLRWASSVGNNYTIQVAPNLSGPWTAQTNLTSAGEVSAWTDANLGEASQRFYRMIEHGAFTNLLFNADVLPQAIIGGGVDASQTAAQAVFLASQLQGGNRLITNGTLAQSVAQTWSYNPLPNDRMVVQFPNGANLVFYIGGMLGDFSGDANQYLQNFHDFRFRTVSPGVFDMNYNSIQTNGCNLVGSAQGSFISSNVLYSVALVVFGQYCFSSDFGSSTLSDDHTIQGTIEAPGLQLIVNHRHYFYIISDSQSSASSSEDWTGSSLTLGTDTYVWKDVHKHRSFTNGRPSHIDSSQSDLEWVATGTVLKNGAAFGTYRYHFHPADYLVRILLELPGGTLSLETYKRQ